MRGVVMRYSCALWPVNSGENFIIRVIYCCLQGKGNHNPCVTDYGFPSLADNSKYMANPDNEVLTRIYRPKGTTISHDHTPHLECIMIVTTKRV